LALGLRKKIILAFIVPSVAGAIAVAGFLHFALLNAAKENWIPGNRFLIHTLSSYIQQNIDIARKTLEATAQLPTFKSLPDLELIDRKINGIPENADQQKKWHLDALRNELALFSVLFVLTPNGDHYLSHPFSIQKKLQKYNLSDRPYFIEAARTKKTVVSDSFLGADGIPAVAIDVPILNAKGDIQAHLGGVFHLSKLSGLISPGLISPFERAFIVDSKGHLIAHSDKRLLVKQAGNQFEDLGLAKSLLSKTGQDEQSSSVDYTSPTTGKAYLTVHRHFPNGWLLVLLRDIRSLEQEVKPQVVSVSFLMAFLLLAIGGIGVLAVSRVTQKWFKSQDELQKAHSLLEHRVEERTRNLEQQKALFEGIFRDVPDAMVLADTNRQIFMANPGFTRIFGYTEDEVIGRDAEFLYLSHSDFILRGRERFNVEATEQIDPYVTNYARKDGTVFPGEAIGTPIKDGKGQTIAFIGLVRDITQRRRTERLVREKSRSIELLQKVAAFANENTDITTVLRTSLQLIGHYFDWSIGHIYFVDKKADKLRPSKIWYLDDAEKYQPFITLTEKTILTPGNGLPGIVAEEGEPVWISDLDAQKKSTFPRRKVWLKIGMLAGFAFPIKVGGRVAAVMEFFAKHDKPPQSVQFEIMDSIAAQLGRAIERSEANEALIESQNRFKDFAESASDWFWEMDEDLRFTFISEGNRGNSYFDKTACIGKKREEITREALTDTKWRKHLDDMKARRPIKDFTYNMVIPDGEERTIRVNGTPLFDEKGRFRGYRGTGKDITEQYQAALELQHAKEQADKANRAKSDFLASMSHELRTPLNAVLGFAQMLQYDPTSPLTPSQEENVGHIIEGGQHLLELVNDILDLVKIEAHQIALLIEDVSANEVVEKCVSLTQPIGIERGIHIIDEFSSGPQFTLKTDKVRFKQVLLNLLSNAAKYNKDGGEVTIRGEKVGHGYLRISVSDTGIGIAEEDFDSVFEVFQRLDADAMVAREGTGIGLTVTKLIVSELAGRIGFDSELGKGSVFWFELPLTENQEVLIWSDTLRIGIDAIDRDHRRLLELINAPALRTGNNHEVALVLNELTHYVHNHFRREEAVMRICKYPALKKHIKGHKNLTDTVQQLSREWSNAPTDQTLSQLRVFLSQWLFDHIVRHDKELAHFVTGREKEIEHFLFNLELDDSA